MVDPAYAIAGNTAKEQWRFALRVNPLFVMAYWIFWSLPLFIGIQMFVRDRGLVWERTEKVDANHNLVRVFEILDQGNRPADSTDWSAAPRRTGADVQHTRR